MNEEPRALDIGEVIAASGVPASTLHVWEKAGLVETCGRQGLRRQYPAEVLNRIAVIVLSQSVGFSLAEIAELLAPDAFKSGKGLLEVKLAELLMRRDELEAAIEGLEHALACDSSSPHQCPTFVATLSDVLPATKKPQSKI